MKSYSQELKDHLIARMLAPHNESITVLARENRNPKDTLYGWRTAALGRAAPIPPNQAPPGAAPNKELKVPLLVRDPPPKRP